MKIGAVVQALKSLTDALIPFAAKMHSEQTAKERDCILDRLQELEIRVLANGKYQQNLKKAYATAQQGRDTWHNAWERIMLNHTLLVKELADERFKNSLLEREYKELKGRMEGLEK